MKDYDIKGIKKYKKQLEKQRNAADETVFTLSFSESIAKKTRAEDPKTSETAEMIASEQASPTEALPEAVPAPDAVGEALRDDIEPSAPESAFFETNGIGAKPAPVIEIAVEKVVEELVIIEETKPAAMERAEPRDHYSNDLESSETALILLPRRLPVTIPVRGWDNRTGSMTDTFIILMPDNSILGDKAAEAEATNERTAQETEYPAVTKNLLVPEVIYLSGDIAPPEPFIRRMARRIFTPRFVAAAALTLALLGPLLSLHSFGSLCYLSDESTPHLPQKVIWTTANSPRDIAETVTDLHEADHVAVEAFGSTQMLTVVRSYPVSLTADGGTDTVKVLDITVAELLEQQGVTLQTEDILSHDLDTVLEEGDEVVIQRVTYENRTAVETVPHEITRRMSPLLRADSEYVAREGQDGSAERIYREKYIDGALVGSEMIEEEILEEPVVEIVTVGDPTAAASYLNGSDFTDIEIVNGAPTEYERVIESAVCTAYSFPAPVFGASGMSLIQGFVAVNPDVIPYGTLMYIASDRFTYGWAVAADCGTAMMEGYVDIDCFFETYADSVAFGKKWLNVYIVKQLTQSELEDYAANGMFYGRVPG